MIYGWTKPAGTAFFELKGPDSVRYLNGQVSNDVSIDLTDKVIAACVCTLKGKIEALVRITAGSEKDTLLIEVDATQAEDVFTRLDRYLIADDCELTEMESPPGIIHIIADQPPSENAKQHWRYGEKGYDIYTDTPPTDTLEFSADQLQQKQIRHGVPQFGYEISGDEFPASLGLDKWAVNFHKGCYLGQEIVSRIESAGKIPKRLKLYLTEKPFEKGHTFSNEAGKEIASVTRDSVAHPDEAGKHLTSVLAKQGFEEPGFEEIAIEYPSAI